LLPRCDQEIWIPACGDAALDVVKPSQNKEVIAARVQKVTGKTINNNLIPLRGIFAASIDDELIERSPVSNIRCLRHQHPKPDPFDREEMEEVLTYLAGHYDEQVHNWYEFAFGTGLRPSEQIVA